MIMISCRLLLLFLCWIFPEQMNLSISVELITRIFDQFKGTCLFSALTTKKPRQSRYDGFRATYTKERSTHSKWPNAVLSAFPFLLTHCFLFPAVTLTRRFAFSAVIFLFCAFKIALMALQCSWWRKFWAIIFRLLRSRHWWRWDIYMAVFFSNGVPRIRKSWLGRHYFQGPSSWPGSSGFFRSEANRKKC